MRLVFVDTETGGLEECHPIIQIAAIAVGENLQSIASFERKLKFNESEADAEALNMNSYDPLLWKQEAVEPRIACTDFAAFLKQYADVECISKRNGTRYYVAQLAAHNAEFDIPRLMALFKSEGIFMPGAFLGLCTLQRAMWYFYEHSECRRPENMKLGTLLEFFEVCPADEHLHDAMVDCAASLGIYRKLLELERE